MTSPSHLISSPFVREETSGGDRNPTHREVVQERSKEEAGVELAPSSEDPTPRSGRVGKK